LEEVAMGLGGILVIVAILVTLILFVLFVVKNAKLWGAWQIVVMSILFIECWVFLISTAFVHDQRVRATWDAFKEKARAEKAVKEVEQLRYGSVSDPEEALNAVIPVQGQLDRLTIDRGRIWRQVTFVKHSKVQEKDQVQLSFQNAQAAAPAGGGPPPASGAASLPQNMLVYGFQEVLDPEAKPLPIFYLGEYRVVATDAASGSVTLESTSPLHPLHLAKIGQGTESWTLFELLPIDSHSAFIAPGSQPSDEAIFGRPEEDKIKELLANSPPEVLSAYLRDGQTAEASDSPESIWTQINLLKEYKLDVDADQSADATRSGYFDSSGRAIDSRLKRKEMVTLDPNELKNNRIVLPEPDAKKLIDAGVAQLTRRVFVRPLNDYGQLFSMLSAQDYELVEQSKYYKYNSQLIEQANQDALNMLTETQKEKQLLESDLSNYQKEIQILNAAVTEANSELESLKQKLSKLYQEIQGKRDALVSTN
jgi:uncharacterized coiled-coil protein SlyX